MTGFSEIVQRRATPGIVILDQNHRVRFCNEEALGMIPSLKETRQSRKPSIPPEIANLCHQLEAYREERLGGESADSQSAVLMGTSHPPYSLRAFFLGTNEAEKGTHIMLLIERIAEKHDIDFEKVREEFQLSAREIDVLKLLCDGLSNRSIAERLFISEHTTKDHLKNIMRKMKVTSRSQIIITLK